MKSTVAGLEVENLLDWSEPRVVRSKGKDIMIRDAVPNEDFWDLWKERKAQLRDAGVTVGKYANRFIVTWWLDGDPAGDVVQQNLPDEQVNEEGLLPWQIENVKRAKFFFKTGSTKWFLDKSPTGWGKTYTSCAIAREFGYELFVVCPKSVIPSWQRVATALGCKVKAIVNYERLKAKNPYVKWFDEWPEFMFSTKNILFIFDEAHRCKSHRKTLNARLLIGAVKRGFTGGILSATLAESPLHLRAAGYALGLHDLRNYWDWAVENGCAKNHFNGWSFMGSQKVLQDIHNNIQTRCGFGVDTGKFKGQFPETKIIAETYSFNEDIAAIYEKMQTRIQALEEKTANYGASVLTEIMAARQETELLKIPQVVEMVEDAVEEGMSVAVFLNFNESLEALSEMLKCPYTIKGGQKADERQQFIDLFQSDQAHVILCNIQAGGEGISLHGLGEGGGRPRLALIMPTYTAAALKQALGRVHRSGGNYSIQKILFAEGTIEEEICLSVRRKLDNIDTLNDGDTVGNLR